METFSALLAICAGNSPVPGEFPAQRPVTRSFDVFFDLRPNKRLSKQSWGWWFETSSCSLWRHCNEKSPDYLLFVGTCQHVQMMLSFSHSRSSGGALIPNYNLGWTYLQSKFHYGVQRSLDKSRKIVYSDSDWSPLDALHELHCPQLSRRRCHGYCQRKRTTVCAPHLLGRANLSAKNTGHLPTWRKKTIL